MAAATVDSGEYTEMFAHFVEEFERGVVASTLPVHYREVYAQLGDWMARWSRAFR